MSNGVVTIKSKSVQSHSVKPSRNWDDITRKMRSGDSDALTVYYEKTFDLMFQTISRITGRDESTCLDLVQESMLKAIRCIKPLANQNAVFAWSTTVAKTVAYDWLRQQNRRQHQSLIDGDEFDTNSTSTHLLDQARLLWVEQQLQSLPAELQKLLSLRYRLGWSLKKIGEKLGIKTGAVDGRIRRALEKLQEMAKREFDE